MTDDLKLLNQTIQNQLATIDRLTARCDELEYYLCSLLVAFYPSGDLAYPDLLEARVPFIRKALGHSSPKDDAKAAEENWARIKIRKIEAGETKPDGSPIDYPVEMPSPRIP